MPDGRDEAVGSAKGPVTCPDGADAEDVAASELDRAADEWDTVIPAGAVVHPTSGINATRPTATISRCDLLAVTTDPARLTPGKVTPGRFRSGCCSATSQWQQRCDPTQPLHPVGGGVGVGGDLVEAVGLRRAAGHRQPTVDRQQAFGDDIGVQK